MRDGVVMSLGEVCRNASRRFLPPEDGKVWFINTGDVEGGRFTHNDLSDWEGLPGQAKKAIVAGDILYSEIRPGNGRYAFVDQQYPNAVVSTKFMVIEAGESILPKYLYHVITSPELQNSMKLIAESRSGTFPQITFDSIAHLELMVPSKAEQLAVSSLLDAIEGRIRNNQKMNQTLEDIAKAIFKSWFVDFDPVRAKMEGRPTGLPPEISDLFPDELVDSEIGEIPKGWGVACFTETFEFFSGGTPKTSAAEYWGGNVPWFSIADLSASSPWVIETEKNITELGLSKCSAKLISIGTIIVTARGTVGKVALAGQDMAINQSCYAMAPASGYPNSWLYLQTLELVERLRANAHGSVFDTITRKTFEQILVLSAPTEVLDIFGAMTSPLFDRMKTADKESKTLSELRDTLLPKLISGELRIPDAEKFLEEAGL